MKNKYLRFLFLCTFLLCTFHFGTDTAFSAPLNKINDGPYIFIQDQKILAKWVKQGQLYEMEIQQQNFSEFKSKFGFDFTFDTLTKNYTANINDQQHFSGVDSIVAISDIHGQYELYIDLLTRNCIIDDQKNWCFGSGHLVIVGDAVDRGDRTTEILWHIFNLEKQAKGAGGMVHFVLGNHEIMVLNNDLRYIHKKYKITENLLGLSYNNLYSENSVLGKWLRSKPIILTIDDNVFVHGGISEQVINNGLNIADINRIFRERIYGYPKSMIIQDKLLELLYRGEGPIWYRGYFDGKLFGEENLDRILNALNGKCVIVGHTTQDKVVEEFNGKLYCVDSNIKSGKSGEILVIKKGQFYRCTLWGERIKF